MAGGGNKNRFQYCTDSSGTIVYLRALQGHSGRNLIHPLLQACRMCNLHSVIRSGLIPGGQKLNNRQTVFFLPVGPMDKNHKDPDVIDLSVPRRAR